MKKTLLRVLTLAFAGSLLVAGSALATPTAQMRLTADGAAGPVTIVDNGAGDLASTVDGIITTFNYALGNFVITTTMGSSKPTIGSIAAPAMHLNASTNSYGSNGGLLKVEFTDTGFGPLYSNITGFLSTMSGLGGVQSLDVYYDASNTAFGTATHIADLDTNSSVFLNGIPTANPFSMTMVATMKIGANSAASVDDGVKVPEPATMLLFGAGLVGLVGFGSRRRRSMGGTFA